MPSPSDTTAPAVNVPFTDPSTGKLTRYGQAMLAALLNRTGGTGEGFDITVLQQYVNSQLQDDREAPSPGVAALLQAQIAPNDEPPRIFFPSPDPDQPGDGLLWAYVRRLESRISELEEAP